MRTGDPFGSDSPGAAVRAWLTSGRDGLAAHVRALHDVNRRLWALEDAVRDPALAAEAVRDHKRAIDAANLERHAAVACIDRAVDDAFGPQRDPDDPLAVVDSQSVGAMVDRLSVIALKIEGFGDDPARAAAQRARAAHVERCLERVVDALRRGDGVAQAFDEGKRYGTRTSSMRTGRWSE
jgi:hypothetical protein